MHVYKVLSTAEWARFENDGRFAGAPIDLRDGYIHLSTAEQLAETLRLHFHGRGDLVIAQVDIQRLGEALRWEPARGGQRFPHLYAALELDAVIATRTVELGADGAPTPAGRPAP